MIRNWIIREEDLDGGDPIPRFSHDVITIANYSFEENENLYISGFLGTGKTTVLQLMYYRLSVEKKGSILLLVFRKVDEERLKIMFKEYGLDANVMNLWKFKTSSVHYDYILCDDVQLIGRSYLSEIKKRAKHVIVTMNPVIEIFRSCPLTHEPTLTYNDVQEILQPTVFDLHFSHLTENAINIAQTLLNKDIPYHPYNPIHIDAQAYICKVDNDLDETKYIHDQAQRGITRGYSTAVLIPTNRGIVSFINNLIQLEGKESWKQKLDKYGRIDFSDLNQYMSSIGLNYQIIGNSCGSLTDIGTKTTLMTYHGSMGFVFDYVFMPNLNSDLFISYDESISRNLFVLALTRSKKDVYLLYSGTKHPYIDEMIEICNIDVMSIDDDSSFGHLEI